jgi:hypothetical protein
MENHRLEHLPKTPVVIEGATYNLCGSFAALVEAETFFNMLGAQVNLADAIFSVRQGANSALSAVRQIFPCAMRTFHPEISYASAQAMIDRMNALDDPAIIQAVARRIWPARTYETEAVNQNLIFDFEALADANEFFAGKTGLILTCAGDPFTLDHACRVFCCAVHRFRPELGLSEALSLMTLPSVIAVIGALGLAKQAASQETLDRFTARVFAAASEEERQEFLFRVLAKQLWSGAARA